MNLARIDMEEKKPQQAEQRYKAVLKYDDKHVGAMIGLAALAATSSTAQQRPAPIQTDLGP